MTYLEIVKFLAANLNVSEAQVKLSLNKASVFRGIVLTKSNFQIQEDSADKYIDICGGKCPFRLFHIIAKGQKKKKEATVYSFKFMQNGKEKFSITTSPRKVKKCYDPYLKMIFLKYWKMEKVNIVNMMI